MKGAMNEIEVCEALKPLTMLYVDVTKAPRVGASFSTSRSELSFGRFSGAFQEVHEGIGGRFWAFQKAHEGSFEGGRRSM